MKSSHIFYNLVTGTGLLIYNETAYPLAGPFKTREDAEAAGDDLIAHLNTSDPGRPTTRSCQSQKTCPELKVQLKAAEDRRFFGRARDRTELRLTLV